MNVWLELLIDFSSHTVELNLQREAMHGKLHDIMVLYTSHLIPWTDAIRKCPPPAAPVIETTQPLPMVQTWFTSQLDRPLVGHIQSPARQHTKTPFVV